MHFSSFKGHKGLVLCYRNNWLTITPDLSLAMLSVDVYTRCSGVSMDETQE